MSKPNSTGKAINKSMPKPRSKKELQQLKLILAARKKALKNAPEGYLTIYNSHGAEQYYHVISEQGQKKRYYLSTKDDVELIAALAQKSYDMSVVKALEQEIHAWEMLAKLLPGIPAKELYKTLGPARQKYVTPIFPTDEEYRKEWEAVTYQTGFFSENAPVYITDRGERVRSKSEQLIANLLYRLGIPYRYEYPIILDVNGKKKTFRPDFMILDVKNRKEYFIEHFGMLDDASENNYALSASQKMKIYEENGLHDGDAMIYSWETSRAPLDIEHLELRLKWKFGLSK